MGLQQASPYGCRLGRSLMSRRIQAKPRSGRPSLGEEAVGDPALIEDLDRPRMQAAGTRADDVLARPPSTIATSTPARASSPASIRPGRTGADDDHGVVAQRYPAPPRPWSTRSGRRRRRHGRPVGTNWTTIELTATLTATAVMTAT